MLDLNEMETRPKTLEDYQAENAREECDEAKQDAEGFERILAGRPKRYTCQTDTDLSMILFHSASTTT